MTKASRLAQPGVLSVVAGVLGGLVVVAYVAIVTSQGESSWEQVVAWALAMAVPPVLAFASLRLPQRSARWTRIAAAVLFAAFGIVSSLGLGLMPAATLAALAAYQTREAVPAPADPPRSHR